MSEKITVSNFVLRNLVAALNSLDGIKMGKDIVEPFEFEDGVQWNLSKNAVICERGLEAYNHAVKAFMKTRRVIKGEPLTEANRDRVVALQTDVDGLDSKKETLEGLLFITLAELRTRPARDDRKAGKNLIPLSVLKALNPIIRETAR